MRKTTKNKKKKIKENKPIESFSSDSIFKKLVLLQQNLKTYYAGQ